MAINKGENRGKFENIPEGIEIFSKITKNQEFRKMFEQINKLPEDKRAEFIEKEFERKALIKKGVRPRGAIVKFRPIDKTKKGIKLNSQIHLDILIPEIGILSIRRKY